MPRPRFMAHLSRFTPQYISISSQKQYLFCIATNLTYRPRHPLSV